MSSRYANNELKAYLLMRFGNYFNTCDRLRFSTSSLKDSFYRDEIKIIIAESSTKIQSFQSLFWTNPNRQTDLKQFLNFSLEIGINFEIKDIHLNCISLYYIHLF